MTITGRHRDHRTTTRLARRLVAPALALSPGEVGGFSRTTPFARYRDGSLEACFTRLGG